MDVDSPNGVDDLTDRVDSADRKTPTDQNGSAAREPAGVWDQRLARLAAGHPSSPVDANGNPKPPVPSLRDQDYPPPLTDAEHAEHVRDIKKRLDKAHGDGLATYLQHTVDPDHEQWTDERTIKHDVIIADLYAAAADVPCERRAVLAGGLPGAGKTTVLEHFVDIDRSRYLTISPDGIKEEMARHGMIPQVAQLTPMEASDLVHKESSYVAKQLAIRAVGDGKNIIWDVSMSTRESTEERISSLRDAGYSGIEGVFVDIPMEVSVRRADARHRHGNELYLAGQGDGGRFLPAEVISVQDDPDWGSRNRKTFEQVKPLLDAWSVFDNSADGRDPKLVSHGGKEGERR